MLRTRKRDEDHEIVIADDGVGFDVPTYMNTDHKKSIGIENVRKRLWSMCKGTLSITSEKGRGTRVVIRIPVDE